MQSTPNLRTFYLYKLLTSLQLTVPIYVLFLLDNGLSMTQVMLLQSFYTALIVIFEIPSGVVADIYGRKASLILASLFLSAAFVTFALSSAYLPFFAAAFLWAVARSLASGADTALLFDSLKAAGHTARFPRHNGRSNALEMLTLGGSAIVGGLLAGRIGERPLFAIAALIFATSLLAALMFREPRTHRPIIMKHHLSHLTRSLRFARTQPIVRAYTLFFAFLGAFAFMLYYLIQPYFNQGDSPKLLVGAAVAGYFICTSIGSFFAEHVIRRFQPASLALTAILLSALIFTAIPHVPLWTGILLVFIHSLVIGAAGVLANERINSHTPSHRRATVLSVLNFLQKMIYALAAPAIGYLTDTYTIQAAFIMTGIILLLFLAPMAMLARAATPGTGTASS